MCVVLFVYTDPYQHGVCDFSPHATLPQGIETKTTLNCDVSSIRQSPPPHITSLHMPLPPLPPQDLSPLRVTLFHLETWSAATMPKSGAVLSLLERTRAGQKEGSTSPVVVACK